MSISFSQLLAQLAQSYIDIAIMAPSIKYTVYCPTRPFVLREGQIDAHTYSYCVHEEVFSVIYLLEKLSQPAQTLTRTPQKSKGRRILFSSKKKKKEHKWPYKVVELRLMSLRLNVTVHILVTAVPLTATLCTIYSTLSKLCRADLKQEQSEKVK